MWVSWERHALCRTCFARDAWRVLFVKAVGSKGFRRFRVVGVLKTGFSGTV